MELLNKRQTVVGIQSSLRNSSLSLFSKKRANCSLSDSFASGLMGVMLDTKT